MIFVTLSFNVYIDEAGDEGFTIKDGKWVSSRWFVMGALITHPKSDVALAKCVDTIKADFKWSKGNPLHFTSFSHEKKKHVINCMVKTGSFRVCYVAIDKMKIDGAASLKNEKRYLYNYVTRYLLERVSWLIGDLKGTADLIFENRANTSYTELNSYITGLIGKTEVQIRDGVIKSWRSVNKSQLKNIQLADAVTSGLYNAIQADRFGNVEYSYVEMLKPFIYCRNGNYHAYGLKFFPKACSDSDLIYEFPWISGFTNKQIVVR